MTFLFNNSNDRHLLTEPISIGCEAWIDVDRFCATATLTQRAPTASSDSSLTKSFTHIRRKFRKSSDQDIG